MMLKLMEKKSSKPKLTEKEVSKQLGFCDSTIKRYSDDINMDSAFEGNKNGKKKKQIKHLNISTPNSDKERKY